MQKSGLYEQYYVDYGYSYRYREPTGRWKITKGTGDAHSDNIQLWLEVYTKFLWLIPMTKWVSESNLFYFKYEETIYEC